MPRRSRGERATLDDVARRAGVSKATVSKSLNGRGDVAEATRDRVRAAVAELGYRSTTGRATASFPDAVVVAFGIPASPYIMNVLQGVLAAATEQGLDLLTRLPPEPAVRDDLPAARAWVTAQRARGAIGAIALTLANPDTLIQAAAEAGLPLVMVDPVNARDERAVSVGSSNWAGARAATEHLIELGHRRIGWIGGPAGSSAAQDRFYGFTAAMDAAGLPADPALVRGDLFTVASGSRHAHDLLTHPDPPTAILAASDEIAVGTLAAARDLDIRVPESLSVVGFDDTPQSAWTTPPLTTVHQHLDGMGRIAVQTVTDMAAGRHPASRHLELATSLTIRGSTTVLHPRHVLAPTRQTCSRPRSQDEPMFA